MTTTALALEVLRAPLCKILQSYNSPGDWAWELFKPSTDSASLVVKIEKKQFSVSVGGFLEVTSQRGHVLEKQATLALGPNPLIHFFGSKFCWKLGDNQRL